MAAVNVSDVTGVVITPSAATVDRGQTQQFTAAVSSINDPDKTVTWAISTDNINWGTITADGSSIDSSGYLTISGSETALSLTVMATSTANTSMSDTATVNIQTTIPETIFEFFWVNEHGSLVTTSGGAVTIAVGEKLSISARDSSYSVVQWRLNGVDTGESGNTFNFSSPIAGRHTIGIFVEKGGMLFNTNITITVQ